MKYVKCYCSKHWIIFLVKFGKNATEIKCGIMKTTAAPLHLYFHEVNKIDMYTETERMTELFVSLVYTLFPI